jgi:hypothetical protein
MASQRAEVITVNSNGLYICEICGTQSADHAGWFSLAGRGSRMEILPWNDDSSVSPEFRHACCGDHVQQLVFSSATQESVHPSLWLTQHRGGWNPSSLRPKDAPAEPTTEESIMGMINAIDSILQGPTAEEDESPSFDA